MTDAAHDPIALAAAVLDLLGAFLFLASAIWLLRLPDFYTRVHAPTKAATLGVATLYPQTMPAGSSRMLPDSTIPRPEHISTK